MRRALVVASGLWCFVLASVPPADTLRLSAIIAEALEHNPGILAAREQWKAAQARSPQVAALPDPTFGVMLMGSVELEQAIPFPGKRRERRRVAEAETWAAEARVQAAEQDVILKVSNAYFDFVVTDATLSTLEEIRTALAKLEGIAQARYATGSGSQRDIAKTQVELSDVLQRLVALRQYRKSVAALLNALLDRPSDSPVGSLEQPAEPVLSRGLEELLAAAKELRPDLAEASATVKRDTHRVALAKLDYMPDFSVGIKYSPTGTGSADGPNAGRDAWMIPLKVSLPVWRERLEAGVREADRDLRAGRAGQAQVENLIEYEVTDAYYRLTSAKQVIDIYRTALLPQARLAYESDQAGYVAGRVDVLNLIDSERIYLNTELASHQAFGDALKSFAALEKAVGIGLK